MQLLKTVILLTCSMQCFAADFEVHLWPGEGRPVLKAETTKLGLRSAPYIASPIINRVIVKIGMPIQFDLTRFRTIKPGLLTALKNTSVNGRLMGALDSLTKEQYYSGNFKTVTFSISSGEKIEYLQYRAEGTCFIRIAGQVVDADQCPTRDPEIFTIESKPKMEWWVRSTIKSTIGWLLVGGGELRVEGRTF